MIIRKAWLSPVISAAWGCPYHAFILSDIAQALMPHCAIGPVSMLSSDRAAAPEHEVPIVSMCTRSQATRYTTYLTWLACRRIVDSLPLEMSAVSAAAPLLSRISPSQFASLMTELAQDSHAFRCSCLTHYCTVIMVSGVYTGLMCFAVRLAMLATRSCIM